ncbi:MAG: L-seryl-tRNA(Sec) selenium transferase, partial [Chloroflexi bacterium]|nr:L-seryl-tRNA(Sec) selenium transferase [Chloroflexota bacterium]
MDDPRCEALIQNYGRTNVTTVVRESLDALREEVLNGQDKSEKLEDLIGSVELKLRSQQTTLKSVVNATGVILHTNLGRAPLSKETTQAMNNINEGYSNLEYNLTTGGRGSRFDHLGTLLRRLTGAEDALILNNNAGAVLTTLAAICAGGEVIISRGQLVEIGGGFRIPDVMSQSGCILREVGTTNRTRASDYLEAMGPDTKALMRVHPSNFSIEGFTEEASLTDIVKAAETNDLPVIDDIGSGSLIDSSPFGLTHEPLLSECIKDGADLVLASGDKLIGGPQSGIILGRKDLIARIKKHPLTRALRPDKGTIAGLIETLKHYEREEATTAIPIWQMISADTESLSARASEYVNAWKGNATVIPH